MVGWKMDCPARDRVLKLMEEKDRLESEIRDQTAVLESNHIGMHEPLVDDLGYPRNDIDVYKVRHARHLIICMQNDHKNLMKMIEKGLAEIHSDLLGANGESHFNGHTSNGHTNGHTSSNLMRNDRSRDNVVKEPFAIVTTVTNGSPADLAGLCTNDMLLQFGSITHTNFEEMMQINHIVSHSVGQPINVLVKRGSGVISINLVPRPWMQPGLLGCHIQRLS